jgi:Haem-binding domain
LTRKRLRDRITWRGVAMVGAVFVLALGLIQFVPYRYSNPPVVQEPPWDSPRTRELAVAACFDCHSNETDPYWFENIAPAVWLITSDVDAGRDKLNFSECTLDEGGGDGDDAAEEVLEESMPPSQYTLFGLLHPEAQLNRAEREELARGLAATLANADCDE